jgi:hypothetical protein
MLQFFFFPPLYCELTYMYGVAVLYTHNFSTSIWQQLNVLPAVNFFSPVYVLIGLGFSGTKNYFRSSFMEKKLGNSWLE